MNPSWYIWCKDPSCSSDLHRNALSTHKDCLVVDGTERDKLAASGLCGAWRVRRDWAASRNDTMR